MKALIVLLGTIFLGQLSQASDLSSVSTGQPLPLLEITQKGELILSDDEIIYQDWVSSELSRQKIHVIQYLAGRVSASKINEPFTDQLELLNKSLDMNHYLSTTIINLDDTFFGTSGFVNRELKKTNNSIHTLALLQTKTGLD